jgi:DNA-binding SARP family transcriptional activator
MGRAILHSTAVFSAKYASPRSTPAWAECDTPRWLLAPSVTCISTPPGFLHLPDVAHELGDDALWIWLDEFDNDPVSLLGSIGAGVRLRLGVGSDVLLRNSWVADSLDTAEAWRERLGLFGTELANALQGRALVLCSGGARLRSTALDTVLNGLFPTMGESRVVLATGETPLAPSLAPATVGKQQLRLTSAEVGVLGRSLAPELSPATVRRAAKVVNGRSATLTQVLLTGSLLDPLVFRRILARASSLDDLLQSLVIMSLRDARQEVVATLAIVARLGITHPRLIEATLGQSSTLGAPWLLDLEDDWGFADPLWRRALSMALGPSGGLDREALGRLGSQLVAEGAPELALALFWDANDLRGLSHALDLFAERPDAERRWAIRGHGLLLPHSDTPTGCRRSEDSAGRTRAGSWRWIQRLFCPRPSTPTLALPTFVLPSPTSEPAVRPVPADVLIVDPKPERSVATVPSPAVTAPWGDATCVVRLLGLFEFSIDGVTVTDWAGARGRSVLKYLLVHRGRPVRKETLMETFWPGADPDASRNRLNVALSSLRRSLRPVVGDMPVVLHHEGTYRLNPALSPWVDVEAFEQRAAVGVKLHRSGDMAAASVALRDAVDLYRGAFVEDDLFEEWTSSPRERLRVLFLDLLDRLGDIAFSQGNYDTCIEVGRKILADDSCREDTHRRLMRCYGRQGRPHLALRQYHACVSSLRSELAVDPSAETVALYEDIRQHRLV